MAPSPARARTTRRALAGLLTGGAGALATAATVRAARHRPLADEAVAAGATRPHLPGTGETAPLDVRSPEELADRLLQLCHYATIAAPDHGDTDPAPFHEMQESMTRLYPRLHEELELERVGRHGTGLLFRWPGSDPTLAEAPLLLMAHQDVVPVEGQEWTVDPFAGDLSDSPGAGGGLRVTARGTLDDKGAMLTVLEGVELLLERGFSPRRDVYLFFGDCEETGGPTAQETTDLLRQRGITPWLVLDEGGAVVEPGVLPGVGPAAGMIAVAEKGTLDLRLSTSDPGGHASTPGRGGATARIARAILRLERHPFPSRLPAPTAHMISALGRHAPLAARLLYANVRPLAPLVAAGLAALGPETAAMTRTTVAVTQLSGSPASNVLATSATATLNVRLAVGTRADDAVGRIRRVVDDPSITLTVLGSTEPSRVSPVDDDRWALLARLVAEVFPDAVAAPYIQNGATDARRFSPWCDHVYRFAPLRMSGADRGRLHAADESVAASTLPEGVRFMARLVEEAAG